ncbi:MAG: NERD domain-containing protein [Actinobacteria bacterium]|nr:NERD domain-containing protein [Actinomycetota bacterium]MCG2807320.1 NERD domain-containing protein [Coriobacteriia bacterium]
MAQIVGNPGESAGVRGALILGSLSVVTFVFFVLPSAYAFAVYSARWGAVGVVVVMTIILGACWWKRADLADAIGFMREGRNWVKGASGEYRVHKALCELSDEYIVFHDYHPRGRDGRPAAWNVDHIVVGPSGVFVLDAKNYSPKTVSAALEGTCFARNVDQVQRNALELKDKLGLWSGGDLAGVFVVPVVVYTQDGAQLANLREGVVRTLPLRLLRQEIEGHRESAIDQEKTGRVALALFAQLPTKTQVAFGGAIQAYGRISKAARYEICDARVAQRREASVARDSHGEPGAALPTTCPKCGGRLAERTAKTGSRAGKKFLGCENYYSEKKCKYGYNLD